MFCVCVVKIIVGFVLKGLFNCELFKLYLIVEIFCFLFVLDVLNFKKFIGFGYWGLNFGVKYVMVVNNIINIVSGLSNFEIFLV